MYDEPAFRTNVDKSNPMYNSQENLAAAPEQAAGLEMIDYGEQDPGNFDEDQGGYLDVQADPDNGYNQETGYNPEAGADNQAAGATEAALDPTDIIANSAATFEADFNPGTE